MSRIPTHSIDDAPTASQEILKGVVQFSPTGRPLNLHAQMAHSPAVLVAYSSIRKALVEYGTLGQAISAALMLASAQVSDSAYAVAVTFRLAQAAGWKPDQLDALQAGAPTGNEKLDALVKVVREAVGDSGRVSDTTWHAATQAGWTDEEMAEAFAFLGLTVFTAYFLNYAETDLDLPADVSAA